MIRREFGKFFHGLALAAGLGVAEPSFAEPPRGRDGGQETIPSHFDVKNVPTILPTHDKTSMDKRSQVAFESLNGLASFITEARSAGAAWQKLSREDQAHFTRAVFEYTRLLAVGFRNKLIGRVPFNPEQIRDLDRKRQQLEGIFPGILPGSEQFLLQLKNAPLEKMYASYRAVARAQGKQEAAIASNEVPSTVPSTSVQRPPEIFKTSERPPEKVIIELKIKTIAGHPTVAITIDDGPHPRNTPRMREILGDKNVPATFFVIGENVTLHPEIVADTMRAGHEVGLHAERHLNWQKTYGHDPARAMSEQLEPVKLKVDTITNKLNAEKNPKATIKPVRFFRPPEGAVTPSQLKLLAARGLWTADWSTDSHDSSPHPASPEKLAHNAVHSLRPGGVILLHDHGGRSRQRSIAALPLIIDELRAKGYIFVTMSQGMGLEAVSPEQVASQFPLQPKTTVVAPNQDPPLEAVSSATTRIADASPVILSVPASQALAPELPKHHLATMDEIEALLLRKKP
ncbi:MAG: hypothetical protein EXS55_03670 [Candidatus Magasanikbacteria bacterium]|nr:hypothetical protein [Candidatus Magasanikbacteria bacterium]